MEFLTPEVMKVLLELGAFGALLFLYVHDRVVGEPRRTVAAEARFDKILSDFREERDEDREERRADRAALIQLVSAVEKLETRIEGLRPN